jgi:hypothetical protein
MPGPNGIKLFTVRNLRMLPGAYPRVEFQKVASGKEILALPADFSLGWRGLTGASRQTLAYYEQS